MERGVGDGGRWREIDALFRHVLDLPSADRVAALDGAGHTDPELRAEVEALLRSVDEASRFLEEPGIQIPPDLLEVLADADPGLEGETIGPWRLLDVIARGGMGTVYRAERADGRFEQQAAFKVLRRGLDTDDIVGRFRAERQILASFDHPDIARLLDGGATPDGRPFLVMEYVAGEPIDAYCARRGLGVEERLRLFVRAARAVQHAHQRLVLHRDLKPSNVLVTGDGQVKLLDFGIAKLLGDEWESVTPRTKTGVRLLTPSWASPEQVRGEPAGVPSDVYQLGLILYKLLTGALPLELERLRGRAAERAILEGDPGPPSATVRASRPASPAAGGPPGTPRARARRLSGDLDTIVLTALRKDPERRYASVEELAADVERHLERRPIRARPDTRSYRLRKYAQRHPWGLAAAGLLLALGVGYAATVTMYARRLATEATRSAEVTRFLVDVFRVADPYVSSGDEVTAREVLETAAQRVRGELADQPEVRADLLAAIAQVYANLQLDTRALPLAREALQLRREHLPPDHPDLAEALRLRAIAAAGAGRPDEAYFREALRAAEVVHGRDHPRVAELLRYWAEARGVGGVPGADTLYDRALEILRSHPGDNRAELAQTLAQSSWGRPVEEAIPLQREALALRRDVYGEGHVRVAWSLSDLALTLEEVDPPQAEALLRQALEIHRDARGDTHPVTLEIINNLAGVLRARGTLSEAEELYRELVVVRRETGPDEVPTAYSIYGLALVLERQGRAAEAEPLFREILTIFPERDPRRVFIQAGLARSLIAQRRYGAAEPILLEALSQVDDPAASDHGREVAEALATLYEETGRTARAAEYREASAEAVSTGG